MTSTARNAMAFSIVRCRTIIHDLNNKLYDNKELADSSQKILDELKELEEKVIQLPALHIEED